MAVAPVLALLVRNMSAAILGEKRTEGQRDVAEAVLAYFEQIEIAGSWSLVEAQVNL